MTINPNGNAGGADLPAVEHHRKTSRRLIRQSRYELERFCNILLGESSESDPSRDYRAAFHLALCCSTALCNAR